MSYDGFETYPCQFDGNCPDCEISDIFVNRELASMEASLRKAEKGTLFYMLFVLTPAGRTDVLDSIR